MEFGDGSPARSPAMSPEGVDGESPLFGWPARSPASRQLPNVILSLFLAMIFLKQKTFFKSKLAC